MKVVLLIDSLGSGGAQRQLCTLAVMLRKRGMDVSVLTYHPHDFFFSMLQAEGIHWTCLRSTSPLRHMLAVRQALRRGDQDVVLAFLDAPSLYAELAGLPHRSWGLVVSERLARPRSHLGWHRWLRQLHRLADVITTNSHTNRLMIEQSSNALRSRLVTIYNIVDLERFSYTPPRSCQTSALRIVVAASYQQKKNVCRFIEAFSIARQMVPAVDFHLDWFGGFNRKRDGSIESNVFNSANKIIKSLGLKDFVRLHEATTTIDEVYRSADAVALPSLFEGLPNVICEGMATGRPILMSNVCDAGNLVRAGENGFLFDPKSVRSMAEAIAAMARLSASQRREFGICSRKMAETMFCPETISNYYAEVLTSAANREPITVGHSTTEVPSSAYQSLS